MATDEAGKDSSLSHKLAKGAVEQFGGPVQSFTPVNQICQVRTPSFSIIMHSYTEMGISFMTIASEVCYSFEMQ
jgi:hypothetical protein